MMVEPDRIKALKDQVYRDIEYINNFKSLAPGARIAPDYSPAKMVKSVTTAIYPQIYAYLVQNYSKEEATRRLWEMGRRATALFFAINPKNLKNELRFH